MSFAGCLASVFDPHLNHSCLDSCTQLDLFNYFQDDLKQEHVWFIPGTHYAQTLETWLKLQDSNSKEGIKLLEADAEAKGFGRDEGRKSFYRQVISLTSGVSASQADVCSC